MQAIVKTGYKGYVGQEFVPAQKDKLASLRNASGFVTFRMKVHFIAIGGAVMHNLAIALHKKGYIVTGSDDEIFEPSTVATGKIWTSSRKTWMGSRTDNHVISDTVILGMHAKADNPELIKAREIGIKNHVISRISL